MEMAVLSVFIAEKRAGGLYGLKKGSNRKLDTPRAGRFILKHRSIDIVIRCGIRIRWKDFWPRSYRTNPILGRILKWGKNI
jgi:hypothetical protein